MQEIWGGKKKPVSWELINSYLSVKYRWQFLFNTLLIYTTVRALTFDWGDGSEVSPGGISFTGRLSYYISSWLYWCKNLNTWRGTVSQQHFLKPTKNMTMYLIKALLIWVPPTWTPNLARDIKKNINRVSAFFSRGSLTWNIHETCSRREFRTYSPESRMYLNVGTDRTGLIRVL